MELPIYIDGLQEGTLLLEKQGAVTVVRAQLRDVGRVVRLHLYGEREGYLGIPVPEEGQLCLIKRLSPLDMKRRPQKPEYAAERPMSAKTELARNTDVPQGKHVIWQGGKPYFF